MLKKCLFISLILLHLCQCISIPNKNKNCINCIHDVRIFKTLSRDRGLAVYSQDEDRGLLDFLTKKKKTKTTETTENVALFQVPPHLYGKIMIYDGLKVKIPEDQCFVIRDTYTYETKADKDIKTVPIITLDYELLEDKEKRIKYIEKRIKDLQEQIQFIEEMTAEECNKNNTELRKNGFKNKKQCECYIDFTSSKTYECIQQANKNGKYEDDICMETFNKAEQEAEQKCGKLLVDTENTKCIDNISDVKIFQTLSKYQGLADYNGYDVALFQVPPHLYGKIMIYDGLKVKIPEDQCFVVRDTYTYETKGRDKNINPATVVVVQSKDVKTYESKKETEIKTVPIITLDYKYKPKDKKKNTANKSKQKKKDGKKKQK